MELAVWRGMDPPSACRDLEALKAVDHYELAVAALEACDRADACWVVSDTYAALVVLARRAKDRRAFVIALRIQARAIRRCGQLIAEVGHPFPGRPVKRKGVLTITRERAGIDAGLSKHQTRTALRIAALPLERFEALVESSHPPTITKFAQYGTRRAYKRRMSTEAIYRLDEIGYFDGTMITEDDLTELALLMVREIHKFAAFCRECDYARVGRAVTDRARMKDDLLELIGFLGAVEKNLPPLPK